MKGDAPTAFAVLVIDASGKVVAANATARALWQDKSKPLVNAALPELVAGNDAESKTVPATDTWETFRQTALDRTLEVELVPVNGSARRPTTLSLERSYGGGGTYIAVVVPR